MKLTGESRSTRGETCPSATLSTTNPTWTDPGSNPCLRGEMLATNRLSGKMLSTESSEICYLHLFYYYYYYYYYCLIVSVHCWYNTELSIILHSLNFGIFISKSEIIFIIYDFVLRRFHPAPYTILATFDHGQRSVGQSCQRR
jgi:hypothetical protein